MRLQFNTVLLGLCMAFRHCSSAIQTYTMTSYCNSEISLVGNVTVSRITVDGFFRGDCFVAVETDLMMMFYFESLRIDIKDDTDCDETFLQVYDGLVMGKETPVVLGLETRLCGSRSPVGVFYASGRYLTFRYRSEEPVLSQFSTVVSEFHEGKCHPDEYECSNNRCIPMNIACSGHDPCGDNSDCLLLSHGAIIALVIGGSAGLVIIVALCILCCCWRLNRPGVDKPSKSRDPFAVVTLPSAPQYERIPSYQQHPPPYEAAARYQSSGSYGASRLPVLQENRPSRFPGNFQSTSQYQSTGAYKN